jgi:hypothetical protein
MIRYFCGDASAFTRKSSGMSDGQCGFPPLLVVSLRWRRPRDRCYVALCVGIRVARLN